MAKHKVVTTDAEIDRAVRAAKQLADEPRVIQVEYRPGHGLDLLILKMSDGRRVLIPAKTWKGCNMPGARRLPRSKSPRTGQLFIGPVSIWTTMFRTCCGISTAANAGCRM